ncbi:hypothetical protein G7046_g7359 [Stylonectria norvegica]|nr:hypothetical protein G7046_g7359 [Stylonectria norvegica]
MAAAPISQYIFDEEGMTWITCDFCCGSFQIEHIAAAPKSAECPTSTSPKNPHLKSAEQNASHPHQERTASEITATGPPAAAGLAFTADAPDGAAGCYGFATTVNPPGQQHKRGRLVRRVNVFLKYMLKEGSAIHGYESASLDSFWYWSFFDCAFGLFWVP